MRSVSWKSSSFPRIAGVQWSSTVGSTLWEVHYGAWRRAWQSSWASSLVLWRSRQRPGVSSGRRGRCCGGYRPPGVAWRRSEGPIGQGSCPGQGRSCFRGSCPCRSRAPQKEKFEGGMRSWQYSGWSSAEHVLPQRPGWRRSDRSWRTRLRSQPLWGMAV